MYRCATKDTGFAGIDTSRLLVAGWTFISGWGGRWFLSLESGSKSATLILYEARQFCAWYYLVARWNAIDDGGGNSRYRMGIDVGIYSKPHINPCLYTCLFVA
jgi:hypothetical protein